MNRRPDPARKAQARRYLQQGNADKAFRVLDGLYRKGQYDAELLFQLGTLQGQRGNAPAAAALLQRSVELEARNPDAWFNLGNALQQTGKLDAALAAHDRALTLDPGFVAALVHRASLLDDLGHPVQALETLDAARERAPQLAEIPANRATILDRLGWREEAANEYRQALALSPGNPQLLALASFYFSRIGRPEEALAARQGYPVGRGEHPLVDVAEAVAREKIGDQQAAVALLQPWLDQQPKLAQVWLAYARLCEAGADCSRTAAALEAILDSGVTAHDLTTMLHFEAGRLRDRLGEHNAAWEHISVANRGKRIEGGYSPQRQAAIVDAIIEHDVQAAQPDERPGRHKNGRANRSSLSACHARGPACWSRSWPLTPVFAPVASASR